MAERFDVSRGGTTLAGERWPGGGRTVASTWTRKPESVWWIDAAALPSSAEAAAGVLRQLNVKNGETLLLFGGGGQSASSLPSSRSPGGSR